MPANQTEQLPHPTGLPMTLPPINLGEVEHGISTFLTFLPFLATFFPPLAAVTPFIPVIRGLLTLAQELQTAGHDPVTITNILSTHLESILGQVKTMSIPATQAVDPTTQTQG